VKTEEDDDMSENSRETKPVVVDVGHEVTEYSRFWIDVPVNATKEEIKQLAVKECTENPDRDIFADSDLGESSGLRILEIADEGGQTIVDYSERILLETNYHEIGEQTEIAVNHLKDGALTKDQFIFEVLSVVLDRSRGNGPRLSKDFIEPFKKAALQDTKKKIDYLVNHHQGIVSEETGAVILTTENPYGERGEMANVMANPPSVVSADGKIFYAYEGKDGKTALVSRGNQEITAIYHDGTVSVYPNDAGLFMDSTGLLRSRDREMEIVRDLHHLVPKVVDEANLSLPNEAARAEDGRGPSWDPTED